MNLFFVTEARFVKDRNGRIYSSGSFTYSLWKRYLSVFSSVTVVARVKNDMCMDCDENLVSSGEGVSFLCLPDISGFWGFLKGRKEIIKLMDVEFRKNNAYILRVPGMIGSVATKVLKNRNLPFAVEVVGDPWDVYAPNTPIHSRWRVILRIFGYLSLKHVVRSSKAAIYVTKQYLQRRYPVSYNVYSTYASNVILKDSYIVNMSVMEFNRKLSIISIGMLAQMYKCPDIVLEAIKILKDEGIDCELVWLGDGKYKEAMKQYACELGVADCVRFEGLIPAGQEVINYILKADVFVLVSQTEGLPRALIEAMACGKFCVATNVGGIPELLESKWLVKPRDAKALANMIIYAINNPQEVYAQVKQNLQKVMDYRESVLIQRRNEFYQYVEKMSYVDGFNR